MIEPLADYYVPENWRNVICTPLMQAWFLQMRQRELNGQPSGYQVYDHNAIQTVRHLLKEVDDQTVWLIHPSLLTRRTPRFVCLLKPWSGQFTREFNFEGTVEHVPVLTVQPAVEHLIHRLKPKSTEESWITPFSIPKEHRFWKLKDWD